MQIVEFLRARLDEQEALVAKAMEPDWSGEKPRFYGPGTEGGHKDDWGLWTFHVLPERALADIAAKRAILEFHKQWPILVEGPSEMVESDSSGLDSIAFKMSKQIAWMTDQEYRNRFGDEPPTTPIMRALASIYSDHPDYDESWRS